MSLGRSFEERPKLEAQFFRNFSCCGLDLQDLHGLLEHFEECHVAFEDDGATDGGMEVEMEMDDGGSEGTISGPPSPRMLQGGHPRSVYEIKKSALSSFETGSSPSSPASTNLHLDPGMELDMDMDDTPPFQLHTPHQTLSSHASTSSLSSTTSSAALPPPMSAFDSPLPSLQSNKKKFSTAMNPASMRGIGGMGMGGMMGLDALAAARAASAYSTPDSSIPGTPVMEEIPGGGVDGLFSVPANSLHNPATINPHLGLAPSLLFPSTPADSPPSDSGSNADGSQSNGSGRDSTDGTPVVVLSALPSALHPLGTGVQISPSGRPYTPPSEKPFKCSVAGCDKSYKQQNGLKYHRLHGHCNQNNVGKEGMEARGEGKPYVCHVTSCGKRYKK